MQASRAARDKYLTSYELNKFYMEQSVQSRVNTAERQNHYSTLLTVQCLAHNKRVQKYSVFYSFIQRFITDSSSLTPCFESQTKWNGNAERDRVAESARRGHVWGGGMPLPENFLIFTARPNCSQCRAL